MSDHKHYEHDMHSEAATTKVSVVFSRPVEEALVGWLNSMADSSATQAHINLLAAQVTNLTARLHKANSGLRAALEKDT